MGRCFTFLKSLPCPTFKKSTKINLVTQNELPKNPQKNLFKNLHPQIVGAKNITF